jgi:hypothetical protein
MYITDVHYIHFIEVKQDHPSVQGVERHRRLRAYWFLSDISRSELPGPKPGNVLHPNDLHGVTLYAVGQHIIFMHHQLSRAGHPAGPTQRGKRQQHLSFFLDLAHERTCARGIVLPNIGSYLVQIFKRLARPAELHDP